MKNRIEYVLKHNKLIYSIFSFLASIFLKALSLFLKTNDRYVLFVSFMGKSYNDSPKLIYEYLLKNGYDTSNCIWAFKEPKNFNINCKKVKIDTLKYFIIALRCKYWVSNVNIERGLHFKKKKTIYINTWHGIPLKKIGNDCFNRKDYDFRKINYLCVSGSYEEKIYSSAFKTSSINYFRTGMPRNDSLYRPDKIDVLNIKKKLKIDYNKKIILYAPTWRDSLDGGVSYNLRPPISFKYWKEHLKKEYVVLFRAHSITTNLLNLEFDDFLIDCSKYNDVNDLMIISTLLITDYSAIAFDYSILEKPILLFPYDYEEYLKERGFYFNICDFYNNYIFHNEKSLIQGILELDYLLAIENSKNIKNSFVEYGANATQKCAEIILKEKFI